MKTLVASHLAKSYKGRQVVKDVSLSVNAGQIVGLLGPNGAGKTTTFYMIVGLVPSDKGTISLGGKDITFDPIHARARQGIGYLPQESSIFRKLTVFDNLMAILQTRKDLSDDQRERTADELLDEFNITHIRGSLGMSLSGGERRRVEIARALAANPAFILLDEPFAGVDPIAVEDIQHIIKTLRDKNIGVLITDHNVHETLNITDRSYLLYEGSIMKAGTAEELASDEEVRRVYLGQNFELRG